MPYRFEAEIRIRVPNTMKDTGRLFTKLCISMHAPGCAPPVGCFGLYLLSLIYYIVFGCGTMKIELRELQFLQVS